MNYLLNKESKNKYYYNILFPTFTIHVLGLMGYLYIRDINEAYLITTITIGVFFGWLLIFALPVFILYFNHKKYSKSQ